MLTVESALPTHLGHIPFSPVLDFGALIKQAGASGVLDVNSIEVINLATNTNIEYGRSEDFAYGDKGRLEWAITHPTHRQYEIRFTTAPKRPPLVPQPFVPMVGVGDLLRYNAGVPRPITLQGGQPGRPKKHRAMGSGRLLELLSPSRRAYKRYSLLPAHSRE